MGGLAVFLILAASLCGAGVSAVVETKSQNRDELFAEFIDLFQNFREDQNNRGQIGLREENSYSTNPNTCQCTCKYNIAGEYGAGFACPYYYPNCGGWLRAFLGKPRDCQELYQQRYTKTGVYVIFPEGLPEGIYVRCDMDTAGGGWTVIQRRVNKDGDFYRDWSDYKRGFGDLNENFWLGNENIFALTSQDSYELFIELAFVGRNKSYAKYNSFIVGGENSSYLLTVEGYSGNAGDSYSYHSGAKFTTKDRDNDSYGGNCADIGKGGWWYRLCHHANLNGVYGKRNKLVCICWVLHVCCVRRYESQKT